MALSRGDRVDRYVLVEPLGEGGQGSVWKAEDPLEPAQPRALKLVPLVLARPNDVERVRREARALAKLDHGSLVRCHALFEDLKLSLLGIVMDFVDGASLRAAADEPWMTDRHRTLALRHVARALSYVHSLGVVHRDLKLENVLVTRAFWDKPELASNVKLVDFGIAKMADGAQALTAVDTLVGTISYLSPEILDPAFFDSSGSSPAADVFAFGVMAYRLMLEGHPTGLPPRAGIVDYGAAYRAAAKSDVPWPPDAPSNAWGELLRDCLRVRANERIKDGSELAERCERAGDWATVLRPPVEAESRSGPTSVASPGAMRGETAIAGPRPTPAALSQTASIGPEPLATLRTAELSRPPPEERSSRVPLVVGALLVAALGGFVAWRITKPGDAAPPTPLSPSSGSGSGPLATALDAASSLAGEALDAAEAAVAPLPASWPSDCSAIAGLCACCPSGRDCSPGRCEEPLAPDDFHLRLGQVVVKGRDLAETSPDLSLCVKRSNQPAEQPVCTRIGDTNGGRVPDQRLFVTGMDLRTGVEVELRATGDAGATVARTKFSGNFKRSVLCKGVVLADLADAGEIERIVLFLDEPKSAPTLRCPGDR